jgi:hypothetical protein
MEPLYESNVNLVGWIEPGWHIWDTNMDWVAYISGGHAWSSGSGSWCGPVNETTCLDRSGQVVAMESGECPAGTGRPARPGRPGRPEGQDGPDGQDGPVDLLVRQDRSMVGLRSRSKRGWRASSSPRPTPRPGGIVVRLRAGPDLDHAQFGSVWGARIRFSCSEAVFVD